MTATNKPHKDQKSKGSNSNNYNKKNVRNVTCHERRKISKTKNYYLDENKGIVWRQ